MLSVLLSKYLPTKINNVCSKTTDVNTALSLLSQNYCLRIINIIPHNKNSKNSFHNNISGNYHDCVMSARVIFFRDMILLACHQIIQSLSLTKNMSKGQYNYLKDYHRTPFIMIMILKFCSTHLVKSIFFCHTYKSIS